jgi:hypothetical protein
MRRSAVPCSKCTGPCGTPVPALALGRVSQSQTTKHQNSRSLLPAAAGMSYPVRQKQLPAGLLPAAVGTAAAGDRRVAAAATLQTEGPTSNPDFDRSVYLDAATQPGHFVGPVAITNIPGMLSSCTHVSQHYSPAIWRYRYVCARLHCLCSAPCSFVFIVPWCNMGRRCNLSQPTAIAKIRIADPGMHTR